MSTTLQSAASLGNRLAEAGCTLPAAQLAPLESFVASKLRPFGAAIAELIRSAVAESGNFRSQRLDEFLAAIIAGLKQRLSQQKSAMFADPAFVALERTNRAVEELVHQKDGAGVKQRVLNVRLGDLTTALANANGDAERSAFYPPLCRNEFHRPGGRPNKYVVLLDDVGPEHSALLQALIAIGREGHAPVLASVKPAVFCPQDPERDAPPEDFRDLPQQPPDLVAEYGKADNVPLHGVQASPHATHLALTVGKVVGRAPYHPLRNAAPRSEWFVESNGPLLIPSQVLLAKSLAASFTKFKTGVRLAGVHSGGKHTRPTVVAEGQVQTTEIEIDELLAKAFEQCGCICYLPWKHKDFVVNFNTPTAFVPRPSGDAATDGDATVASQLPNIMLSCQFGQLLKAKLRESLGQTVNEADLQRKLHAEFSKFVTPDLNSVDQATLARKPLAKVQVWVQQQLPGAFVATAQIQPHPLLNSAHVTLTLKAEISPNKP